MQTSGKNSANKLVAILVITLLIGVALGYFPFHLHTQTREKTKTPVPSIYQVCSNSTNQPCVVAGNVSYNQTDLATARGLLNGTYPNNLTYDWSPIFYQKNSSVNFTFTFPKNKYFNSSFYPGNPNSENWTYPTTVYFGVNGNLLFIYMVVMRWMTGPYAFNGSYGSISEFNIFAQSGNYSYGFTNWVEMLPENPNVTNALYSPWITNRFGLYNYPVFNYPAPTNTTFGVNPNANLSISPTLNNSSCSLIKYYPSNGAGVNGSEAIAGGKGNTSWAGNGLVFGSYKEPLFTSLLYVINITNVENRFGNIDGYPYLDLKFNLNTVLNPAAYYICQHSFAEFYAINSEWPINNIYAINNYSTYMRVIL